MKIKDVNIDKIEQLLNDSDDELYIVSITFQGSEPVLNLYKPYDDSEKRKAETQALLAEFMEWIEQNDNNPNFLYNSGGE